MYPYVALGTALYDQSLIVVVLTVVIFLVALTIWQDFSIMSTPPSYNYQNPHYHQ